MISPIGGMQSQLLKTVYKLGLGAFGFVTEFLSEKLFLIF
jgi:hypothetical protein